MKIEKWIDNVINEYRENYCPMSSFNFDDLSNIYFGMGSSYRFLGGRKVWRTLWCNFNSQMLPLGLFACGCWGWKHDREYGVLEIGKQKIVLSRNGNILFFRKGDKIIGEIDYGIWLRLIYIGSSTLKLSNGETGKISLPINSPPASYNFNDCFGRISFKNDCKIKYLIETNDVNKEIAEKGMYKSPFNRCLLKISPIYTKESCEMLKQFNGDEDNFYVFLIIAFWSRMFYTYW